LLGRLKGRDFDANMNEDYTDEDRNSVRFVGEKIYSVQTCHLYYTTYDLQWDSDTVNPRTHPDIMLRSPEVEEGAEPYWYARVIGVITLAMYGPIEKTSQVQKCEADGLSLGALAWQRTPLCFWFSGLQSLQTSLRSAL
jgi:hypothetical protein